MWRRGRRCGRWSGRWGLHRLRRFGASSLTRGAPTQQSDPSAGRCRSGWAGCEGVIRSGPTAFSDPTFAGVTPRKRTTPHSATPELGAQWIKGYSAEEIVGQHFSRFYVPEDVQARKPERELQVAAAEGRCEDEGWRVRKDGSRFWANVVVTPLRNPDGALLGFAKLTRDLTERRRVEGAMRQTEERLRLMVESVKDHAILMLDREGRVISWNAGAERIKGYRADEILGRHYSQFYPPEDVAQGKPEWELERAVRDGQL